MGSFISDDTFPDIVVVKVGPDVVGDVVKVDFDGCVVVDVEVAVDVVVDVVVDAVDEVVVEVVVKVVVDDVVEVVVEVVVLSVMICVVPVMVSIVGHCFGFFSSSHSHGLSITMKP